MKKEKEITKNGNGKVEYINGEKVEYLPKDFEIDTSPTAIAMMKAIRLTRKRLYPELYKGKTKRG